MIKLGENQKLKIIRNSEYGLFLNTDENADNKDILIPNRYVDESWNIGDFIEVFVYRDSKDRLVATTKEPKIKLGEIALLKVIEITSHGAFLDWGLEKDLFLPFKEQIRKILTGKEYLVSLYIDKSERLCATMNIYDLLRSDSEYSVGDEVSGIIYMMNKDMGAFVAVDNLYHGMIANKELFGEYKLGKVINCRVINVREDGKLDLSIRKKSYIQMDDDAELIYSRLKENGGLLPFNDNTSPDIIKEEFGLSKRAFKRAIGKLLKEKKIKQESTGIELIADELK